MVIFAGNGGYLDEVPVRDVAAFEKDFLAFMSGPKASLRNQIAEKKELTDEFKAALRDAILEFKRTWKGAAK
jgi:F-type H+-transporting ATPase subunit alpha